MKFILYMASSIDGFIAKKNNETPWSDEEWELFTEKVKDIGCIIMGRKTHDIMKKSNVFNNLGNILTIIFSNNKNISKNSENFIFVSTIDELIKVLENRNISTSLIVGGKSINSLFLRNKLINEIFIDIESFIFNVGINMFDELDFDVLKIELLSVKMVSKNLVQLHYILIN